MGTPELFVYGTLTMDAVVHALVDRVPSCTDATAPGWRAALLPRLPYPGLVADPGAITLGRVYQDLSPSEWALLDAFENPDYLVEVVQLDDGRRALAYVWPFEAREETWATSSLGDAEADAYLKRCAAWRERYESVGGSRS